MMRKYSCCVILVTFVHTASYRCFSRTGSGEPCCADYEKKGNDCVLCSIGYTSYFGQSCRPCSKNTYGQRCAHDCFCSADEICDHIDGCVEASSSTSTLTYETDKMTSILNLETTSNGENIDSSVQGLLSKELVACFILSVFVMVFGIGFCSVSFKYMALTKQRKATSSIIQSQNSAIPQNSQNIEMENRLYDIINETDMLDDQQVQQMEMLSAYLDVIDDSSKGESSEMKSFENHENPCQLMSTTEMHRQENI